MNERISRQAADRAKSEIMMRVTPRDVAEIFLAAYRQERNTAAHDRLTEGELRSRAVWRVYYAGLTDALAHVTKPEYVPGDFPDDDDEELTEG